MLRVAGRVFLGVGEREDVGETQGGGEQDESPETQRSRNVPPTMFASAAGLLLLGVLVGLVPQLRENTAAQAHRLLDAQAYQLRVLTGALPAELHAAPAAPLTESLVHAILALLAALGLAAAGLFPTRLAPVAAILAKPLFGLRKLHSGHVGDYVAWLVFGVASFGVACALALR